MPNQNVPINNLSQGTNNGFVAGAANIGNIDQSAKNTINVY